MDDLEFLDPVDVLSQLPQDFQTNLESKKWTERRDALQALLDLLEKHPKLEKKCQYGEIVEQLRKTLEKDANINVCALAAKCLRGIAHGLRQSFGPHALGVVPVIFEKFKEKKPVLKDPLVQCIDTIFLTTNMDNLIESICAAMEKTNPTIKKETDLFLSRCFMYYSASTMPKKALKAFAPLLVKHTSDSDQEVREASYNALGSAMRATGEKPISTLLAEISEDNMKMGKIREFSQKYMEEVGANGLNQSGSSSGGGGGGGAATNKAQEESSNGSAASNHNSAASAPAAMKEVDPFDLIDPVDVLAKLPPDFQTNLESAKWTERRDALQALLDLLEKFPKLDPKVQYGEIMDSLKKILSKDSNINVCALAGKCTRGIAAGLRVKFAPHAISVVPIILDKFKEKKPVLRDPMVACIDAVTAFINLDQIEEEIVAAMENKNPSIKAQTDLFLARSFKNLNSQTMPKKMLKNVAAILVKHSCDSDPEVREASCGALGSAMRVIGEPAIMPLLSGVSEDKTKMDKIREQCQKMISEYGPAVTAAQPAAAPAKQPPPGAKKPPPQVKKPLSRAGSTTSLNGEAEEAPKAPAAPAKKTEKKAAPPKEEEDESASEPPKNAELLTTTETKPQRIKDEKQMKVIKWNFATPTDEHIAQLTQQFGSVAKVSLTQLLFSKDFKQHMKAIDTLKALGESAPEGLVKNSDLLLKWCTLRFFETNPAVLIKVLELCKQIIMLLRDFEEPVSLEEINSFIPYLLVKTGEQKENMRTAVHEIINELTDICGPLKLTPFLIDALKTKNSRQRAECLTILEEYITRGGVAALKATGIHKAIGGCVSDRDTGVRNAAINGLVACYREEGDQMWKNVGKLADKDRSYVEERIKRTGAAPGSAKPSVVSTPVRSGGAKVVVPPNANATVVRRNRSRSRLPEIEDSDDVRDDDGEDLLNTTQIRPSTSRYAIDEDTNSLPIQSKKNKANFQFVELTGAHALPSSQLMQEAESYAPRMPAMPIRPAPSTPLKRSGSSSSISSLDSYDQLEKVIHNVSSGIGEVAQAALENVIYMMKSEEQKLMIEDRISITMQAVATQLNLVRKIHGIRTSKGNTLLRLILNFFLALTQVPKRINMDEEAMSDWLYAIIPILPALDGEQDEQTKKSFNVTIIRVSQRVEVTVFFVACCRSLQNILREDPNSPSVELFVKCLYKWQDVIKKQPQPLRLKPFLAAANEFYHNLAQDDIHAEHIKSMELCLQHAILIMGDAVQDGIRRLPNPNHKMLSYCNVFLSQMYNSDPSWQPKLPGAVADELPQPKSSRPEATAMRRDIHIFVDNVVRDLNSLENHVSKLVEYLEKNPTEAQEYDKYTQRCCMGTTVRKTVDNFRKNRRIAPISNQFYVDMAQSAMAQQAKLEKYLKGGMENGHGAPNILQTRDINTESFTSELPLPTNLTGIVRTPVEEVKTRKVRRSIDPAVYNAIQSKLAGIGDS